MMSTFNGMVCDLDTMLAKSADTQARPPLSLIPAFLGCIIGTFDILARQLWQNEVWTLTGGELGVLKQSCARVAFAHL